MKSNVGQAQPGSAEAGNDFPAKLSKPALRALASAGYTHLNQLAMISESELLQLHGMGPKGIVLLREALAANGQSFAKRV